MNRDNEIDIEALKNNKEFLANLELLEEEMKTQESIKKGYQLLDSLLLIDGDEEKINDVFNFVLNQAFDRISQHLVAHTTLSMRDEEDIATARAIYDHAIQLYDERSFKSAKELFLVLHHLVDYYKLQEAMMIYAIHTMKEVVFDEFSTTILDTKRYDENIELAYFFMNFKIEPKDFLSENKKYVDQAKEELKVLKKK
ncbi:MAG: hypothetical protein JXQ76_09070 [Campylobacterales bacterium]|nr:hypothetical protein [Campylobacterales bacterium]